MTHSIEVAPDSRPILLFEDAPAIEVAPDSRPILVLNVPTDQRLYITVDGIQLTVDGQPVWILQ